METALSINIEDDAEAWGERGEYWRNFSTEPKVRGRKPRFLHQPLILSGHGLSIRVDRGSLLVRNGFTHYPQQREETRYFPKDRRLPSRIVIIDGDGSITFDALKWLSIQGVSVVQIDWQGQVVSTTCSLGYGADPALMRVQLELQDNEAGISFARYLVDLKFRNAIETLDKKFAPSPAAELCIARMHKWLDTLRNNPPTTLHALLVIEAHAAIAYFRCWQSKSLQWKGIGKKLIPEDWHRIVARMTTEEGNQFARHPLNAILNYAYGMLENQVRTMVLAMGFDPTIGFLHAYEPRRSTLIFDLMEPLRPVMDRRILDFIFSNKFTPHDFVVSNMGVCKLHPQLARVIVKLVQDMPEVEEITTANLKHLLKHNPDAVRNAAKNATNYKNRNTGKREKASS